MNRYFRLLSIFTLIALLFSLAVQSADARPAAEIPLPGKWVGQWTRALTMENCTIDPCVTGTATYNMPIMLRVADGGTITAGEISIAADIVVNVVALGYSNTCEATAEYTVSGGKVTPGSDGLPIFAVTMSAKSSSVVCSEGGDMGEGSYGGNYDFTMTPTSSQGSTVLGKQIAFTDDKFGWAIQNMITAGFTVASEENWDMTNTSPFLNAIEPTYERYFLQGVRLVNDYKATIDWNNNLPGKVIFEWDDDQSAEVAATMEEVIFPMQLDVLPDGLNSLKATAYTADNEPTVSRETPIVIVPLPAWASTANFAVSERLSDGPLSYVIYKGSVNAPAEAIKLPFLDLTGIPLVDGKWGIPAIQVPVTLLATSAGGQSEEAPMDGTFELYLGGQEPEFDLKFEGNTITNMQADSLTIYESQLKTTVPIFNKEEQVGLLDLVPAMRALTNVPIIGDLTEAINGILALHGTLHVNVDGLVDVGPNQAGTELTFTKGSIKPWITTTVQAMINFFNLASAWVGGGGAGNFTLQIVPEPQWENCYLALTFNAGAQVSGVFERHYQKEWPLNACTGSASTINKVSADATRPLPLALIKRAATWLPERAVLERVRINGVDQTTLVENASPEAAPALAIGPENRLAFAWISEDPIRPRLQAKEIALRLYDGQTWGETLTLTQNATFDASPAVAFDRAGGVMVAWVQHKRDNLPEATEFDVAFAEALEIRYAVVDPATGQVLRQASLTDDGVMDFNPQLARGQDGTLWLAWISSPGNSLTGNAAHPNYLLAARWDGAKWSNPETVTDELVGTLTWRLAAFNAERVLVASDLDTDGSLSTATDREIYLAERGSAGWTSRPLTNNTVLDLAPLAAYTPEGEPLLAWASEGALLGLDGDLQAAPQTWLPLANPTSLLNAVLVVGAGDERMLLWPSQTAAMDIQVSRYDPASGVWSAPMAFLGQPRQAAAISAGITSSGNLVVGLAALDTITNTVTLPTGEAFEMPAQAITAQLVVAGVKASFQPQSPMIVEDVTLAPESPLSSDGLPGDRMRWLGGGALLCCCCLLVILLIAGAFFFWRRAKKA